MRPNLRRGLALGFALLLLLSVPAMFVEPVGASHGGTHIDDFEDGDITVETSGWNGWQGDTGSFSASSVNPLSGSNSGVLTASNEETRVNVVADSSATPDRIAFRTLIGSDVGDGGDQVQYFLRDADTIAFRITFEDSSGDIIVNSFDGGQASAVDTGVDWIPGVRYNVEFRDVNYTEDTYDLYINGEAALEDQDFENSVSGIDEFEIGSKTSASGDTRSVRIDDLELNGVNFQPPSSFTGGTIDDFEDGDLQIDVDGWAGWFLETDSFELTEDSLSGSFSGSINVTAGDEERVKAISDSGNYAPEEVSAQIRVSEDVGAPGDSTQIQIRDGDTLIARITFEDDSRDISLNSANENDGGGVDTGETWTPGATYDVAFTNINWTSNTFDFVLNGFVIETDVLFEESANGMDRIDFHTDTDSSGESREATFDNVEMTLGDRVTGSVVTQNGDPGTLIQVTAYENAPSLPVVGNTVTDANGDWALDLDDGEYVIQYSGPGWHETHREVTVDGPTSFNHEVQAISTQYRNATPRGGEYIRDREESFNVSVNVSDPGQYPVNTTVYWFNGTSEQFESIHEENQWDGSVDIDFEFPEEPNPGVNQWVVVSSTTRGQFNSSVYTFETPGDIEIRDAVFLNDRVTDAEITATIESLDSDFQTTGVTQPDNGDWDGVIDLNDIPKEDYRIQFESTAGDDYAPTTVTFDSERVTDRSIIVMVNQTTFDSEPEWYAQEFRLVDNTGQWAPRNTYLLLQQRVDGEYQTVAGDIFGVQNSLTLPVNDTENYRLTLLHAVRGSQRNIGTFKADRDLEGEIIEVEISETFEPVPGDEGYAITGSIQSGDESTIPTLIVAFNDPEEATVDFEFTVYERHNESNVLVPVDGSDSLGSETFSYELTDEQTESSWVVEWEAERNGDPINGSFVVGGEFLETGIPIPDGVKQGIAFFGIVLPAVAVGGGTRAEVGAMVAAIMGGIFWYLNFLPPVAGGGVMALGVFVAVLFSAKDRGRAP